MVTKLQLSPRKTELQLHVAGSVANDVHRGGRAALDLQHFTNHVHFSKCDRVHPSDSGCSMHMAVCRLQAAATCIRAYEGCVRSYCSLHAGTHAACTQPACLPSVNPALLVHQPSVTSDCVGSLVGLAGRENFTGEWEEFVFNAFVNLEPVQRVS